METKKNLSASVMARLYNQARHRGRPLNDLLQFYAIERFLFRLSCSDYANSFILKGALMFVALKLHSFRPTRDIDLLGYTSNEVENIVRIMQEICLQPVEPDGLTFDPETIRGHRINEDADYQGVRVQFVATLGKAHMPMQIDVGFSDIVWPSPIESDYPTILPQKGPHLRGYSLESIIAEKVQAMVYLGIVNSRLKDFYDVWTLINEFDFDGQTLTQAFEKTFSHRKTALPEGIPQALTEDFAHDKQVQWQAFGKRIGSNLNIPTLEVVIEMLRNFLMPPLEAANNKTGFRAVWKHGMGWVKE